MRHFQQTVNCLKKCLPSNVACQGHNALSSVLVAASFLQIDTLTHKNFSRDKHLPNDSSRIICVLGANLHASIHPGNSRHRRLERATDLHRPAQIVGVQYMDAVGKDACRRSSRTVVSTAQR